ncbi:MAG: hypothetical protein ACKOPP_06290, partial [Bacteroidota bacterium]
MRPLTLYSLRLLMALLVGLSAKPPSSALSIPLFRTTATISGLGSEEDPEVAVGQWRTHLPLNKVSCVEKIGNRVYAGCSGGIFVFDTDDGSLQRLTRVNGMHDVEVAALSYSSTYQTLVVGYANGNLDLYRNGQWLALDAVLKANVPQGKKIRSIHQAGRFAYLCYGFGMVELDLAKTEIRSTFIIGPQGTYLGVNALVSQDGYWYAATDSGLYRARQDAPNLQSFEFWQRDTALGTQRIPGLALYRDSLVTFEGDSLIFYKAGGQRRLVVNAGADNVFVGESAGQLLVVNAFRTVRFDQNLIPSNYPIPDGVVSPSMALYDGYQVWMGDQGGGLFRFTPWETFRYQPEGPSTDKVFQLRAHARGTAVAGGAYSSVFGNTFDPAGAAWLQGNRWRALNRQSLKGVGNLYDVTGAFPDPHTEGRVWLSTWGQGLWQVDGDSGHVFNTTNSALQVQQGTSNVVRLSGVDM